MRRRIRVEGIVQGVGFRPFVHRLATELQLSGHVGNDAAGVFIEAQGPPDAVAALVERVRDRPPPLAVVDRVTAAPMRCRRGTGFTIVDSDRNGHPSVLISPDVATCDDCLSELRDPDDRRYGYPFINCTNCGPRFTIVTGVPYDRPFTTMASFTMCAECHREYDDPTDRRFHAQPTCCPGCGPRLRLQAAGATVDDNVVAATARMLLDGAVVAVKGLGGYHLAAVANDTKAVAALRSRKHREEKPFAVLCADVDDARRLVHLDHRAEALLTSPQRPVVLLPRRADAEVAEQVAPRNGNLGVLLPYTPLHHLLIEAVGRPVVLTSGNVSDEPIAYHDDDARARLGDIADAFLTHDRAIQIRTDDSVVRVARDRSFPIRRARGYAPGPVPLPIAASRPILGCGAELKNTFTLATETRAFVSHHIGDLENVETLQSFVGGITHFRRLFAVDPQVVAHDLHPDYLSTKWAMEQPDVDLVGVQHHHAHIASCLADNGVTGPAIGVAFDGLGYGTDGTLWGGEIIVADLLGFRRAAHLAAVPMPGGARAIREPWRMAVSWLLAAYDETPPEDVGVLARHGEQWRDVAAVARSTLSHRTSSIGRLFDAVAAVCGVRDVVTYEGQAAVELEQLADRHAPGAYPLPVCGDVLDGGALVRAVVDDLRRGVDVPVVAARFHAGLAQATAATCAEIRAATGLEVVALSGGVFQNLLLLDRLADLLESDGFHVLTQSRVPPNDGGISLGQVAVAAARTAADLTSAAS